MKDDALILPMKKNLLLFVLCLSVISCGNKNDSSSSSPSADEDLHLQLADNYSPTGLDDKVFVTNGIQYAPMDLLSQDLVLTFDATGQTTKGKSVIKFRVKKTGRPYFELLATISNMKLDSQAVSVSSITDPDGQSQSYRSVNQEVSPGKIHTVEFEYQLPSGRVSFTNGGVGFLTDMTDLNGKFFEYWGPTGFEEDAFAMNLDLKLVNSTSAHALYTNGNVASTGSQDWKINFPNYFSKSSFYIHLTNSTGLTSKKIVYHGLEKDIPIEVYGITASLVDTAVAQLPKLFAELEGDYGPYAHAKFVAYMNDRSGGMEYVGATITSVASIDHELLHSWFARSVIPADGRSGWIDEAMASWRDYGYATATSVLQRTPTNLSNYSPFRKSTPSNSYVDGRAIMAELDREFDAIGGLKPVMKAFFEKYKNKVVTNEEFWSFLQVYTTLNMTPFNLRYAMSESQETDEPAPSEEPSKHPTPLTEEEILRLR